MKAAFFVEEEIGCRGSAQADLEFFTNCRYVVQCDRRGNNDLITSISFTELCSKEFIEAIGYENFGYKPEDGMMTDVLELKERGIEVSCINMSCGYYKPHTDQEFTDKNDLLNCQKFVENIIENCAAVYPHKCEDSYYGNLYWEEQEELYLLADELLSCNPDLTAEELKEWYGYYFGHLDIDDYQNILDEVRELNKDDNEKYTA